MTLYLVLCPSFSSAHCYCLLSKTIPYLSCTPIPYAMVCVCLFLHASVLCACIWLSACLHVASSSTFLPSPLSLSLSHLFLDALPSAHRPFDF